MTNYGLWSRCHANSWNLQAFNHVPIQPKLLILYLLTMAHINYFLINEVWFSISICTMKPLNQSNIYQPFVIIKCFFYSFGANYCKGKGIYNHSNLRVKYYCHMEMSCSQHVGRVLRFIHSWLSGPSNSSFL